MVAQIVSLLIGIWLLIAPDVLGYSDPARTVERVIGPVVIVVSALAIRGVTRPVSHLNILTGLALLIAPWLLAYATIPAIANSLLAGIAVLGLAFIRGRMTHTYAGGWASLWNREKLAQGMQQGSDQRQSRERQSRQSIDIARAS